jgi:hypothetical protein
VPAIYGWSTAARSSGGAIFLPRAYGYSIEPVALPSRSYAVVVQARGTRALARGRFRDTPTVGGATIKPRWPFDVRARGTRTRSFGAIPNAYIGPRTATLSYNDGNDAVTSTSVLLGVLGSQVPATGDDGPALLYAEVVANGLQANYVRVEILSVTAGYTLTILGDTSFTVVAPQLTGVCEITYRWYIDGVLQSGTGTATIDFAAFAALALTDAPDIVAATTDAAARSAALALTDAPDTITASMSTPTALRSAALSLSDAADTASATAAVQLVGRTAALFVADSPDTITASVAQVFEDRAAALSIADQDDTLASIAVLTGSRTVSLGVTDSDDMVVAKVRSRPALAAGPSGKKAYGEKRPRQKSGVRR